MQRETRVVKLGRALAIVLPKDWADMNGVYKGAKIGLEFDEKNRGALRIHSPFGWVEFQASQPRRVSVLGMDRIVAQFVMDQSYLASEYRARIRETKGRSPGERGYIATMKERAEERERLIKAFKDPWEKGRDRARKEGVAFSWGDEHFIVEPDPEFDVHTPIEIEGREYVIERTLKPGDEGAPEPKKPKPPIPSPQEQRRKNKICPDCSSPIQLVHMTTKTRIPKKAHFFTYPRIGEANEEVTGIFEGWYYRCAKCGTYWEMLSKGVSEDGKRSD